MTVTLDLQELLIAALIIACTVLVIFLIVAVANLIKALRKVNGILDDTSVVMGIVSEKAQETKPVIDGLASAIVSFANAAKGNETRIASLSSVAKSISSLVSMIKSSK